MSETIKTPEGQKDIIVINAKTEVVKQINPLFLTTVIKAAKVGGYAILGVLVPALITYLSTSQNPYVIIWGPVAVVAVRTLEGIIRFHLGDPEAPKG